MTRDDNKGIASITYNHLNLPKKITFTGSTQNINYIYNALGQKVEKIVTNNLTETTTNYQGMFHYENNILKFFAMAEGYVNVTTGGRQGPDGPSYLFSYIYNYTDHLGNIRLSYTNNSVNGITILEENHYYPFGLKHKKYGATEKRFVKSNGGCFVGIETLPPGIRKTYQYKFQNQERQDELGLNWDSFKWRNYDFAIGRFFNIDPLAEKFPQWSPYVFSGNLVVMARELEGLEPSFLIENNRLSQGAISVMNAAFGYSVNSLTNTTWIPDTDPRTTVLQNRIVDNQYVAMVDGNKVAYSSSISNRRNKYWFGLISHEQQHRQDVDTYGYNLFYGSYVLEVARTLGDTDKMLHEKPGYRNEGYAQQLWDYNGGEVQNIFNTGNITENHRSQMLESVGSRFRRDVILNDVISNTNGLMKNAQGIMEGLGNGKEEQSLKHAIGNMISGWEKTVNKAKKEQDDITKQYGQ